MFETGREYRSFCAGSRPCLKAVLGVKLKTFIYRFYSSPHCKIVGSSSLGLAALQIVCCTSFQILLWQSSISGSHVGRKRMTRALNFISLQAHNMDSNHAYVIST